jgi:hypothetical protein
VVDNRVSHSALTSVRKSATLDEVFHDFHQSLQTNTGILPYHRSKPLPFTTSPTNHSLIILTFESLQATQSKLLTAW